MHVMTMRVGRQAGAARSWFFVTTWTASAAAVPMLCFAQIVTSQSSPNASSFLAAEATLDRDELTVRKKIETNEAQRITHNAKKRPAPRTVAAANFDREASEGKAEGKRLAAELEAIDRRRDLLIQQKKRLAAIEVNWTNAIPPPAAVTAALKTVLNDPAWPLSVRQALAKTKIRWRAEPVSGLEMLNPDSSLPAACEPSTGTLVIKRGFLNHTVAYQKDILAFEFGKLVWERLPNEFQQRFSDEFSGRFAPDNVRRLPNAPDVIEADANSIFAYAYRDFLFDRKTLPNSLVIWWIKSPPHSFHK
jgi:hypothetical protein